MSVQGLEMEWAARVMPLGAVSGDVTEPALGKQWARSAWMLERRWVA